MATHPSAALAHWYCPLALALAAWPLSSCVPNPSTEAAAPVPSSSATAPILDVSTSDTADDSIAEDAAGPADVGDESVDGEPGRTALRPDAALLPRDDPSRITNERCGPGGRGRVIAVSSSRRAVRSPHPGPPPAVALWPLWGEGK